MKDFMSHDFQISRVVLACLVKAGTGKRIHRNRSSHGLVFFLDGGEKILFEDGTKILAEKNTLIYFPKSSCYTIEDRHPSDCYAINFQMSDEVCFTPFRFKVRNAPELLDCFKAAQKLWAKKAPGCQAGAKAWLYRIISAIQNEYALPYGGNSLGKIQPAVSYIHANYAQQAISVEYLADLCQMSSVYLRNLFIKNLGVSPVRYINQLRLQRAAELLSSGLYSVSQVCFLSGFRDESYFSREFKKQFGCPPKEYVP